MVTSADLPMVISNDPAVLLIKSTDFWLTFFSDDLDLLFDFSGDPALLVMILDADVLNFVPGDSAVLAIKSDETLFVFFSGDPELLFVLSDDTAQHIAFSATPPGLEMATRSDLPLVISDNPAVLVAISDFVLFFLVSVLLFDFKDDSERADVSNRGEDFSR
jgi:hypothetical protein